MFGGKQPEKELREAGIHATTIYNTFTPEDELRGRFHEWTFMRQMNCWWAIADRPGGFNLELAKDLAMNEPSATIKPAMAEEGDSLVDHLCHFDESGLYLIEDVDGSLEAEANLPGHYNVVKGSGGRYVPCIAEAAVRSVLNNCVIYSQEGLNEFTRVVREQS